MSYSARNFARTSLFSVFLASLQQRVHCRKTGIFCDEQDNFDIVVSMHDFWLRRGKTLRYNAIKLRILTLKQGEKKLRIFAEMNLKMLFIGWIKLLPGPLCTACAHAGAFCFIKRKSLKLLGSSRSFKLCCALPQRIRALSRRSHSAGGLNEYVKICYLRRPSGSV